MTGRLAVKRSDCYIKKLTDMHLGFLISNNFILFRSKKNFHIVSVLCCQNATGTMWKIFKNETNNKDGKRLDWIEFTNLPYLLVVLG